MGYGGRRKGRTAGGHEVSPCSTRHEVEDVLGAGRGGRSWGGRGRRGGCARDSARRQRPLELGCWLGEDVAHAGAALQPPREGRARRLRVHDGRGSAARAAGCGARTGLLRSLPAGEGSAVQQGQRAARAPQLVLVAGSGCGRGGRHHSHDHDHTILVTTTRASSHDGSAMRDGRTPRAQDYQN